MAEIDPQTRVQHVVLLSFPEPLSAGDDEQLRTMVAAWPETISTMIECRLGRDLTGRRSRGYSYLLHTVFPGPAALAAYLVHPAHVAVVRFLDARDCTRLAFDFPLDVTTDFTA
jgi:hypothetical protein